MKMKTKILSWFKSLMASGHSGDPYEPHDRNRQQDGLYESHDENGQLSSMANYKDGKLDGLRNGFIKTVSCGKSRPIKVIKKMVPGRFIMKTVN